MTVDGSLAGMFSTVDANQSTTTITHDELTFRCEGKCDVSRCRRHALLDCRCTLISDDNYKYRGLASTALLHLPSSGLLFAKGFPFAERLAGRRLLAELHDVRRQGD